MALLMALRQRGVSDYSIGTLSHASSPIPITTSSLVTTGVERREAKGSGPGAA